MPYVPGVLVEPTAAVLSPEDLQKLQQLAVESARTATAPPAKPVPTENGGDEADPHAGLPSNHPRRVEETLSQDWQVVRDFDTLQALVEALNERGEREKGLKEMLDLVLLHFSPL